MHIRCKSILEKAKDGKIILIEPYTVLVEVAAAIKRRTGSKDLAKRIIEGLTSIENVYFIELVSSRAKAAAKLSEETGVRGMDAIVIQVAEEFNIPLITLDKEIMEKASKIVEVKNVEEI